MTTQTHPEANLDLRQAVRQGLQPARGSGWLAGFENLFSKEMGELFRTRRWLWQLIIWVIIIAGFVAFQLFVIPYLASLFPQYKPMEGAFGTTPPEGVGLLMFFNIGVLAGSMGVVILAQDEIIQEKQTGTAAWILSKPASRPAFILTKLLSNTIGALVFIVLIPGLVVLGEIYLAAHKLLPLGPYLAGAGIFMLALFFYITLVIMLGVFFESRGPVLGIALGIMFGSMMVSRLIFPEISYVLPVAMDSIAGAVASGIPLPTMFVSQLIVTAILSIGFILVALWRFQKKEL